MTWARLTYRLQSAGLLFSLAACLGLAAAAAWLTLDMRSILAGCGTAPEPYACTVTYAFQNTHGNAVQMVQLGIGLAMVVVPLVLGVPIVAREIEGRTAMVAWPLARSRIRWLVWRAAPVLLIGLALSVVLGLAAEGMARAYFPHSDIGFQNHGLRGASLVSRFIFVLFAAIALGAIVGRLMPALLLGIPLGVALTTGLGAALPHWVEPAEMDTQTESILAGEFPLNTRLEFRWPDGRPMSDQEYETYLQELYEEDPEPDPELLPHEVFFGIAASRYQEVLVRESAALLAATAAAGALAIAIIGRRRPE